VRVGIPAYHAGQRVGDWLEALRGAADEEDGGLLGLRLEEVVLVAVLEAELEQRRVAHALCRCAGVVGGCLGDELDLSGGYG
jgi:hypothetical protein